MKNYLVINSSNSLAENKGKSMTIPGVSNWFEWSWPIEGEDAGYINTLADQILISNNSLKIFNKLAFLPSIKKLDTSNITYPTYYMSLLFI